MAELDWVSVRSVQRKSLVQITDENALDVIEAVGGAVYFDKGGRRLAVGGTSREVGQWVDRSGAVWPDPYSAGAPFAPDRENGSAS